MMTATVIPLRRMVPGAHRLLLAVDARASQLATKAPAETFVAIGDASTRVVESLRRRMRAATKGKVA